MKKQIRTKSYAYNLCRKNNILKNFKNKGIYIKNIFTKLPKYSELKIGIHYFLYNQDFFNSFDNNWIIDIVFKFNETNLQIKKDIYCNYFPGDNI